MGWPLDFKNVSWEWLVENPLFDDLPQVNEMTGSKTRSDLIKAVSNTWRGGFEPV